MVLQKLWELANVNLRTEEIKINFLTSDDIGSTDWHFAAEEDKLEVFQGQSSWSK